MYLRAQVSDILEYLIIWFSRAKFTFYVLKKLFAFKNQKRYIGEKRQTTSRGRQGSYVISSANTDF